MHPLAAANDMKVQTHLSASGKIHRDGNYIKRIQTRHNDLLTGTVAREG